MPPIRCDRRCTAQLTPRQELECLCVCLGAALCVPCADGCQKDEDESNPLLCVLTSIFSFSMGIIAFVGLLPLALLRALQLVVCECALLPDELQERRPVDLCSLDAFTGGRTDFCGYLECFCTVLLAIFCSPCLLVDYALQRCHVQDDGEVGKEQSQQPVKKWEDAVVGEAKADQIEVVVVEVGHCKPDS